MRISDWSSDVCSSDLTGKAAFGSPNFRYVCRFEGTVSHETGHCGHREQEGTPTLRRLPTLPRYSPVRIASARSRSAAAAPWSPRSEEHTSELQSLMRISSAVFCLEKKTTLYHTSIK